MPQLNMVLWFSDSLESTIVFWLYFVIVNYHFVYLSSQHLVFHESAS